MSRYSAALRMTAFLAVAACAPGVSVSSQSSQPEAPPATNTLSAREQREGWKLLFDGKSLSAWRPYRSRDPRVTPGPDTISSRWTIVDGILTKTRPGEDIVTREEFGDFELAFDWKVSPRGNAGLFFRATEEYNKIYWSAPEFQIADDSLTPDSRNPLTSAGAAYGLYAPPRGVAKFGGNWNSSRIIAKGSHVEHWMNGVKTIEYEAWSPEWKAKVAGSKFNDYPNFGLAKQGLIGIQGDHGGSLELKNIKIRPLK
jgi:hypothetical protein